MTYKNDKYSVEEITGYAEYIPKENSIYTDGDDGTDKVLRIGKNEWEKLEKAKGSEVFDRYVEIIPQ